MDIRVARKGQGKPYNEDDDDSKNHFQCILIVKIISNVFYSKNHFQRIFIVKIISNTFLQ